MKKIATLITALFLLVSCDETFDINRDPDALPPGQANSTIFPAGIAGLAGAQGSYYAIIGGFWSQFWTQNPTSNQYRDIDSYSIGANNYSAAYTAMYDALNDIRTVKAQSEKEGNWNYYLMATVLEVEGSQVLTDLYDDIPYAEANNVNILQPKFNTGKETYELMIADLKAALSKNLSASVGDKPGKDDFIFNGDMEKWTKFGNTLLLKLHMRLTAVNPTLAQSGITTLINSGAQFLDVDAAMTQFEDAADRSNPLYESDRRQLNTTLNLRASKTMFSYLSLNSDPRLAKYYAQPGNPNNQGDWNNTSVPNLSLVQLSPLTPVFFISKEESYFLQAEALTRYYGGAGAKAKYDAGVTAALVRWGQTATDAAGFVNGAYAFPATGTDAQIEAIITQKWIASFPGNGYESFLEQNRTGYPKESAVKQSSELYIPGQLAIAVETKTGNVFPRRIVLPNVVTTRNPNAPAAKLITDKVWWDVN
ncbi:SusD/RagB family nutrient-binding outer membrane lipoprotein [Flavobacterium sp. KACC 22763]|uniref:SusD/RagB family nutrient-binding outer membrane lipoprotein n=1 Tax=Flavobacterium sp. KACC 22763 TaxID=3025668 RepID=UPI002366B213|nr:SusD/RagB family nutrient-binding outer membrane lipoprotein [Flavobacterium sp. KACC 22763]WDF62959.1 SusD/RagB family nutrient-binding outer membrane lipoprotein [Flavobacterium sp. KACC 22763]